MPPSRSESLEIVPPAPSAAPNPKDIARVMQSAYKRNQKAIDDDNDDADADAEVDEIEEAPATKPLPPHPPIAVPPCERCERTRKECRAFPGARCDYCKRLKQKCSNSSGPARGKNASGKKAADPKAIPKGTASKVAGPSGLPQPPANLKRKLPAKPGLSHNGDAENHSIDGEGSTVEEEGHDDPPRVKKRRISKGGPSRSQLVKIVTDMEGSVKRIQASVAKEVEKMNATIRTLNAKISEMDEE